MSDDVSKWLESLDLARYAGAFADNEIGFQDLPFLGEADLIELGLPIGPRRRVEQAITELAETPSPAPAGSVEEAPSTEAERRQLTVMFVDLVGSTKLSGRLDPEDLRMLMRRYQAAVVEVIEKHGGYLANWLGDGAIAYFGWPSAGEDQAVRAVQAGIGATAAVGRLPLLEGSSEMLAARVGIATGQVVVGDLEDGEVGSRGMVTGETPNLAARLQGAAEPGCVVIGQTTRALVRAGFTLDFLGPLELKGFNAPVDAWSVISEQASPDRFETSDRRLTTFTGRMHEVGLLLDRWNQVGEGEGQVAVISGEPGIGKSRIVQTFRDRIEKDPHNPVVFQCTPHHLNSALYPVIRRLEQVAGIVAGDAPNQNLDRMEALLRRATLDIAEVAPLIAALLSIPFEDRYGALEIAAHHQRVATLRALQDQLLALARHEPVLFILEDAHWIDPTTLELIAEIVPRLTGQRILMLITTRPEWQAPFLGHGHVTTLNLTRLSRAQVAAIAQDVAGRELSENVIARITERTDGVPLFVEELTKAMAEVGFDLAEADVPVTLQASLMARLDRLGSAKEIAQIGAVIGREFNRDLLARVIQWSEDDLTAALARLMEAELIFPAPREEIYTFKHALIQDVAYESLLRQRRRALHLSIAGSLLENGSTGAAPEILAHHFERGDDLVNALTWSEKASIAAAERSAQPETVAHASSALRIIGTMSPDDDHGKTELSLLLRLGHAQFGAVGGGAPETIATFEKAELLAARLHDSSSRVIAQYGRYIGQMLTCQLRQAYETANQVAAIARESGVEWMELAAQRQLAGAQFLMGDITEAHENLLRSMRYGEHVVKQIPPGIAHNPATTRHGLLAHVEWAIGDVDAGMTRMDETVATLVRDGADANSISFTLTWATLLGVFHRDAERLRSAATHLIEHASRTGGLFWEQFGRWGLGTAEVWSGNPQGLALVKAAVDGTVATGAKQHVPLQYVCLAEGYALNGHMADALAVLEDAKELIAGTEQRIYEPEMHRLRGVVLEGLDRIGEARAAYETAVAIANAQGSITWRDRAAANFAALDARD